MHVYRHSAPNSAAAECTAQCDAAKAAGGKKKAFYTCVKACAQTACNGMSTAARDAFVAEQAAQEAAKMPEGFLHEVKVAAGACVEACDELETGKGKCKKGCAQGVWDSKTLEEKEAWKQAHKEARQAEKQAEKEAAKAKKEAAKAKKDAGVPVSYEGTIEEWQALGEEAQTEWKIARRNEWLSRSLKDIPSWLRKKMLHAAFLPGHSIAAEPDMADCASETNEKKQRKCNSN